MEGNLLHQDISYVIRGILYQVHNELGQFRGEKQYCDRIEFILKERQIEYVREYVIPESFVGERRGRNRVDFFIAGRVFVEVKVVPSFSPEIFKQCKRYLVSSGKDLLLLVNFYHKSTVIERVLNPNFKNQSHGTP